MDRSMNKWNKEMKHSTLDFGLDRFHSSIQISKFHYQ
jgi:hypothetical protein